MQLFSKENKEVFTNPLNLDHPILVQVLGICSALAVTSQLKPAIVMGLAVTVITAFANVIISALLGVVGASCLWSLGEIIEQRQRVKKGWFPMNPKRKEEYED